MGSTEAMKPYWSNGRVFLWQGHVLDCLAAMEAGSVQCTVTSPPYWGLRDYGLEGVEWPPVSYAPMAGLPPLDIPGCDPGCVHVWGEKIPITGGAGNSPDKPSGFQQKANAGQSGALAQMSKSESSHGQYCQLCGGWRGCLGLEPTPEMFVGHIVLIWRELWRVMRDDATCWLNFGDSYTSGGRSTFGPVIEGHKQATHPEIKNTPRADQPIGLKPKDLIGIPWRVAFALQADGWYLRSDIIWAKGVSFCPTYSGSCMPESVRDRPTTGEEHIFLLAKSKRYFYDATAVRENGVGQTGQSASFARETKDYTTQHRLDRTPTTETTTRNLRSVWTINPGSYAGAHFATFPPALVEPMIRAGTSAKGCCPECGSPWVRVTSKEFVPQQDVSREKGIRGNGSQKPLDKTDSREGYPRGTTAVTTTGWTPTCSCDAGEPVPCTVLDPFAGTFTTGQEAIKLGRRAVGIELSQKYCDEHIIPRLSKGIQMEMTL